MQINKFSTLKQQFEYIKKIFQKDTNTKGGFAIVIFSLEDFSRILNREKDFKDTHFTSEEIEYCRNRASSLAGRYGAKLAIRKALDKKIHWQEINILPSQTQQPIVSFLNTQDTRGQVALSITHDDDLVAAVAASMDDKSIVALGIDAIKNARIANMVENQPNILSRILTPNELGVKMDFFTMTKIWTGKEAVSKALGIGVWHGGSLRDIEILDKKGKPAVKLRGKLAVHAKDLKLNKWKIEFAYDREFTVALVAGSPHS